MAESSKGEYFNFTKFFDICDKMHFVLIIELKNEIKFNELRTDKF